MIVILSPLPSAQPSLPQFPLSPAIRRGRIQGKADSGTEAWTLLLESIICSTPERTPGQPGLNVTKAVQVSSAYAG